MILSGGFVICLSGLDFISEISGGFVMVVIAYLDLPFLLVFVPCYPLVFRGRIFSVGVWLVEVVLCKCCRAEICLSIIQAVMVYMVNDKVSWWIDNRAVHFYKKSLFPDLFSSTCIKGVSALGSIPFVFV